MTPFINIQATSGISGIQIAERKGIGHPDTICDAVAEQLSVALCTYYLEHFGSILHYNVDKALLVGGASEPAYKGGRVIKPMELFLAGRATTMVKGKIIPVEEIAISTAKRWISKNLRFLDSERHITVIPKIRAGSNDLVELFQRFGKGEVPLANDTSFGVGYFPYSPLEKQVLDMETLLNAAETKKIFPFLGEDIKVMGVQNMQMAQFTIAIAFIDRFISGIDDYVQKINSVKAFLATKFPATPGEIHINTADNYNTESIYLTVTGTSAESGDDGQVGRGNRVNGLITPYHPMSLEAASGKNPVSHVGKIYNHFAYDLSRALVESRFADEASVYIVSQIGKPITQPQLLHILLKNRSARKSRVEALAAGMLTELPGYWKKIINPR